MVDVAEQQNQWFARIPIEKIGRKQRLHKVSDYAVQYVRINGFETNSVRVPARAM